VAFIFADLIIAPILNIYRKYYGARMAAFLLGTFFTAMAAAGYVIELVFGGLGLVPDRASAKVPDQGVSWDYTTWLNIVFLLLAAALIARFVSTGGVAMLRMMGGAPDPGGMADGHAGHDHHGMQGEDMSLFRPPDEGAHDEAVRREALRHEAALRGAALRGAALRGAALRGAARPRRAC
jgi:uncharacterized protein